MLKVIYICSGMYEIKRIIKPSNERFIKERAIILSERLNALRIDLNDQQTLEDICSLVTIEKLLNVKRINNIVTQRIQNRIKTQYVRNLTDFTLANMHTVMLMDRRLFESVAQLPNSPLRGLTSVQVSVLCGAWVHLKLNDVVFTASNLMLWVGCSLKTCKDAIYLLVNLGYLQTNDYNQVFKLSGKLPVNKNSAYYSISVEGERVLKDYFKIFIAKFEKMTKESWVVPLLEMLKGDTDFVESTGKKIYNKKEQ